MDSSDFFTCILILGIIGGILFVTFVAIPWTNNLLKEAQQEIEDQKQSALIHDKSYIGTLGMIQYERGWFGLGNIDKTHLTFTDGAKFVFGEVTVTIGENYTVTWQQVTYKSNRTENRNYQIIQTGD